MEEAERKAQQSEKERGEERRAREEAEKKASEAEGKRIQAEKEKEEAEEKRIQAEKEKEEAEGKLAEAVEQAQLERFRSSSKQAEADHVAAMTGQATTSFLEVTAEDKRYRLSKDFRVPDPDEHEPAVQKFMINLLNALLGQIERPENEELKVTDSSDSPKILHADDKIDAFLILRRYLIPSWASIVVPFEFKSNFRKNDNLRDVRLQIHDRIQTCLGNQPKRKRFFGVNVDHNTIEIYRFFYHSTQGKLIPNIERSGLCSLFK